MQNIFTVDPPSVISTFALNDVCETFILFLTVTVTFGQQRLFKAKVFENSEEQSGTENLNVYIKKIKCK